MCNIPVTLPTLSSFLMLYSLRCGCCVIWTWTLLRAAFYLVFFLVIVIRMYMPDPTPEYILSRPHDNYFYCVFMCFVTMIVTECFVIMFAMYLAVGLYYDSAYRVEQYLIGRFCALLVELSTLVILIFHHNYFVGWYLIFLMIIILEFYSFIVVYSYYVDILEEQKAKECANVCDPTLSEFEDYMTYECLPVPQDMQETQDMRGTQDVRVSMSRECPGPRICPGPRFTPEPRDERSDNNSRAMRLWRENCAKLRKPDNMPDYRIQQCKRNPQDPKLCLCAGYKSPTY